MKTVIIISLSLFFLSCEGVNSQGSEKQKKVSVDKEYWSDGMAEVSRYELQQERYGESRPGNLIQVFVPEDFLLDKQVKNEKYQNKNSTRVLKRIESRSFKTGIYQYNMMTSSFTPVDVNKHPKTIKVSSSSQEWCGTTYSQLNLDKENYLHTMHSYFENEVDQETKIKAAIPEEELFAQIRLNPDLLPIGEINIIPSQIVSRFLHLPSIAYSANASIKDYKESEFVGNNLKQYSIQIPDLQRTVNIVFESVTPYKIVGWTDAYPTSFDKNIKITKATLTHQIKDKYWSMNSTQHNDARKLLGLKD